LATAKIFTNDRLQARKIPNGLVFGLNCGINAFLDLLNIENEKCQKPVKSAERARSLGKALVIHIRLLKKNGGQTCKRSKHKPQKGQSAYGFAQDAFGQERSPKPPRLFQQTKPL
jgi:hypothetical protein